MKEKLKQNLSSILIAIVLFLLFMVPLPYYIEKEGGLISTSDRIQIENASPSSGSFHMAYVSELKVNIPLYLISLFHDGWDLIPKEEVVLTNETEEDVYFRSKTMLNESMDNAVIAAYTLANKSIKIEKEDIYVTYIDELADTDLQIQDKILKINDRKVHTKSDINQMVSEFKKGDIVTLEVEHKGERIERKATLIELDDIVLMGIMVSVERELITEPEIKFSFEKSESGSSGGLMMALQIYDNLIEEDITKGLTIAGTGTIDNEGNVGEISGVKYKLQGAVKDGADIFLIPNGENYEEAMNVVEEYDLNITVIGVSTLQEAIQKIKEG